MSKKKYLLALMAFSLSSVMVFANQTIVASDHPVQQPSQPSELPKLSVETRNIYRPATGVEFKQRTIHYDLDGVSIDELRSQLLSRRPKEKQHRVWAGLTETQLETRYQLLSDASGCQINDVDVFLSVTVYLPRWQPRRKAAAQLAQRWNLFDQAIQWHEEGHVQHAIWAANELHEGISALPAELSCSEMDLEVNLKREEIMTLYRFKDETYDAQTNYGVNQGTVL